ncbi:MAG: hypothetical protein ACJ8EL_19130, partial [Rhizomicrobium sp.]
GKLFAMLGSDNREEVANAAARMNGILRNAGLDLHDLWQLGFNENKNEQLAKLMAEMLATDVDLLFKIGKSKLHIFSTMLLHLPKWLLTCIATLIRWRVRHSNNGCGIGSS